MNNVNRSVEADRNPHNGTPGAQELGQGPGPTHIPEDAEHDRVVDPAAHESAANAAQSTLPRQERAASVIPIARHPDDHQSDTPPNGSTADATPTVLALPHERDESTDDTAQAPDPMMVLAKRDIDAGLVDTDMHAIPGLDAKRRADMVPGAGGKPTRKDGSS